MGPERCWFPGDRRTIRDLSPSQVAALRGAAVELLFQEDASAPLPLVCVIPAQVPLSDEEEDAAPPEGMVARGSTGARRIISYTDGFDDRGTLEEDLAKARAVARSFARQQRQQQQTSRSAALGALCAVRSVRTEGRASTGGVEMAIHSALLEVVGRVSVRQLHVLPASEDARLAGGAALVADLAPDQALVDDAWVDELAASPVHAIHKLRPYADECVRHHTAIMAAARELRALGDPMDRLPIDTDMPLPDLVAAARRSAATISGSDLVDRCARPRATDAYGEPVEPDEEVEELRALSFAAWRTLRPPHGPASSGDLAWAFQTRSTLHRLMRAEEIMYNDILKLQGKLDALRAPPPTEPTSWTATNKKNNKKNKNTGDDHEE